MPKVIERIYEQHPDILECISSLMVDLWRKFSPKKVFLLLFYHNELLRIFYVSRKPRKEMPGVSLKRSRIFSSDHAEFLI